MRGAILSAMTVPAVLVSGCPAPTAAPVSLVRFSGDGAEVVVRLADTPTARDFASKLPLVLEFEEFAGAEKIGYLPERLVVDGSPGIAPRTGDLIYYRPWGNLGFYYDAPEGAPVDENVKAVGTVESGGDRLAALETGPVTVESIQEQQ